MIYIYQEHPEKNTWEISDLHPEVSTGLSSSFSSCHLRHWMSTVDSRPGTCQSQKPHLACHVVFVCLHTPQSLNMLETLGLPAANPI